ncbi:MULTISPECIES: DNA polymerase III subunit alpha [Oligella]|uniref:DNA polymerase III subunit alpha n=1 Tax=Oligella TaxID=90243 RepID=UPI0008A4C3F6|nr:MULTISPECIES: DNA polymerase III subunit alpha [Oligella]OFV51380.1 DNA polymerase III subunit alpha [Oligella sp. HMSC09E12]
MSDTLLATAESGAAELSATPAFVHLRTHSEYSVVDGTIRIGDMIKQAKAFNQPALALSDLGNLFGYIKFYKAARQAGIKPIAACDFWIDNPQDEKKPYRCLLIARNHAGYLQLCRLISRSWIDNPQIDRGQLKPEWLADPAETDGLILLSGARAGDIGQALEVGRFEQALSLAEHWAKLFPNRFYIELQRAGFEGDERYVQEALKLAQEAHLPVVATHPIQFLKADDFDVHEVRVCIAEGEVLANANRSKRFNSQQYFPSSEEMLNKFSDIPSATMNAVEIAKRCNLTIQLGKPNLPDFETPEGMTLDEYLISLSHQGLDKRLEFLFPDAEERAKQEPAYRERLALECKIIIDMGFPGYFLIVQDFINWGKSNGVPVGPGRGSGAGSLVAYSLGITDLDPIRYDLLFERFLNPERVSMPDFDIDFCQDQREKVIDYVKEKYGRDAVSQIATFGTLGAKAVVRDVGRVLEMPYSLCDGLSKLIPFNPAKPWSLSDAMEGEPEFRRRYEQDEEVKSIVDASLPLEGLVRNVGMHAGGVLIAPGKLTDFCPLYCQPGHSGSVVSQYDKDDVEQAGLVKFDFLGLRNLTILDWAVRYVQRFNQGQEAFDIMAVPLDDPATYQLLSEGNTTAVFQLESRGMKELLRKLVPSTFEDVIAVLALFRPGPLDSGMVDDFVNRKHGRAEVDYFHPDLTSTLESTYGVIVYQEQVMLISQIIGGYSLGGADLLRRAMGKKKPEEMARHRKIFEEGAIQKGYDGEMAKNLFDLMEKFAGYGFNKSHSAAYALISYQTAWLKHYYPAEFMAATLSSDMDDTAKIEIFWRDALDNGLSILPVDINHSQYRFEPVPDQHQKESGTIRTIRYGMGGVKGVGESAIENILKARELGGEFKDLYDFCSRIDRHTVNKRAIEALIRAGAFDALEPNRRALLGSLAKAIEAAEQKALNADQVSLFGDDSGDIVAHEIQGIKPWSLYEALLEEKRALGFYFSHHLFDVWRDEVRRFAPTPLASLKESRSSQWVAGVLTASRAFQLKDKDERLYFLLIDDGSAQIEVTCDAHLYESCRHLINTDDLLLVQARVSRSSFNNTIRINATALYNLQSARESVATDLTLVLNEAISPKQLHVLMNPFRAEPENGFPGVAVKIQYQPDPATQCEIMLGEEWRVRLNPQLLEGLSAREEISSIEVNY